MSPLAKDAREAAALATGLRPDQIEAAVEEYRKAAEALYTEPEWTALMHFSMRDGGGLAQYLDPSSATQVVLQIESGPRGKDAVRVYVLDGKPFETYGEARAAELLAVTRPKPRGVT